MIRIATWKIVLILLACVLAFAWAAPNILSKEQAAAWEAKAPSFLPTKRVSLGLDLQGGSHLMLQVAIDEALKDQLVNEVQAARNALRSGKIEYTAFRSQKDGFSITLKNADQMGAAKSAIRKMDPDLDIDEPTPGTLEARFTEAKVKAFTSHVIEQSIEIVRRRVDETGTREPVIARQGQDRIVVQVPGLSDPEYLKELLGRTARLSFQLVDTDGSMTGRAGIGSTLLPMQESPGQKLAVKKEELITGAMLTDAQPNFQDGMPAVSFRLNALGAKRFCDVSKANVGKPFAIVLDQTIISAPNIREAICGGSGQISGSFTVQEATDLALLLRAGALPAKLTIVEERTVGPTLGSDSVEAGKKACIFALLFVIVFACTVYGLFGVFASIALVVNMVMLMAVMSVLQATLTLPGIAGMVLAIGLAVDGNVLVFERIKEELRAGRSILSAVDTGYERAKTTIIDSNLTALISALILFSFGTGPIKGFAVTTSIGVGTAYFASMMLTRLMVVTYLRMAKPKQIAA